MKLTAKQEEILGFIREFFRECGMSPTCAEIQRHFHFSSPSTVTSHLNLLEKKEAISRLPGKDRNIRLPDPVRRPRIMEIPVYGSIPAGMPVDQIQESDRSISIDGDAFGISKNARTFSLEVRGDSMIGAGIFDGDYVIVEQRPAKNGDIVAAAIDGEVTLKRLVVQGGKAHLKAENPRYEDLIPVHDLLIQGVFRALIRINRGQA